MTTPAGGAWGLHEHVLPDGRVLLQGELPADLRLSAAEFDALWDEHPAEYPRIVMHGRLVPTPRWTRAYGSPYRYDGSTANPGPVPPRLAPLLDGGRREVDARLNSVTVNWYDAALGHAIGRHRDHRTSMAPGSPIVTISLGADRVFRVRPWRGRGWIDFAARDGTVIVIPYATNLAWTHEVPRLARNRGRRISVTLRAVVGA